MSSCTPSLSIRDRVELCSTMVVSVSASMGTLWPGRRVPSSLAQDLCQPALLLLLCLCLIKTSWEPQHRGEWRRPQEGGEGAQPSAGGDCSAPLLMQAREPELGEQYEAVCDSTYSEAESAAAEVLDLPLPSYFRSRSHSYLRAIQAGCSQDEDTSSVRSISPPPAGSLSGSRTLPTNSECQRSHGGDRALSAWGWGACRQLPSDASWGISSLSH